MDRSKFENQILETNKEYLFIFFLLSRKFSNPDL